MKMFGVNTSNNNKENIFLCWYTVDLKQNLKKRYSMQEMR